MWSNKSEIRHQKKNAREIMATEFSSIFDAAAVNLPSIRSIARNVRLQRRKRHEHLYPTERNQIPEIIPERYRFTGYGKQFLISDSGSDEDDVFDPNGV